jgi:hypothetical protein
MVELTKSQIREAHKLARRLEKHIDSIDNPYALATYIIKKRYGLNPGKKKKKTNWFARHIGRLVKQGYSFKEAVKLAKKGYGSTKNLNITEKKYKIRRKKVSMARRRRRRYTRIRYIRRRARGGLGKFKSFLRPAVLGVGGGVVLGALLDKFGVQLGIDKKVVELGGSYLFGGFQGIVGKLVFDAITTGTFQIPFLTGETAVSQEDPTIVN